MKEKKGYYGYVKKERKKRLLLTLLLLALPLGLILVGYLTTHSIKNLLTVVGVVGCLPACKEAVSLIMIFVVRPMKEEDYKAISGHAGELVMAYELYITSYDNSEFICAAAVCGGHIIGYSDRLKNPPEMIEEHIQKLLAQNGYKEKVRIFTNLNSFLDRLDTLNKNKESLTQIPFTPDPNYPEYNRDQMVCHILLRLAL